MAPQRKCDCGSCKRCKHRDYMRNYYYSSGAAGGSVELSCARCGEKFQCTGRNASYGRKFCTRFCKDRAKKDAQIAARLAAKATLSRSCLQCGGTIGPEMRTDARFCSEQCNSAAHGLKRANGRLTRGSGRRRDVQRAYIIERDRSTCYLCGKVCEPREIHIDHVIAVSDGGSNTADNRAVSCEPCNLKKGARPVTVQLMLVG